MFTANAGSLTSKVTIDKVGNVGFGLITDPDTTVEIYKVGSPQLKLSGGAADYATFAVAADGAMTITTVDADAAEADITLDPDGLTLSTEFIRATTAIYRRYYHVPLGGANPGASGPTWVEADGNTTGGWRLTNSAWFLRGQADVHDDWDGEDLFAEIHFALGVAGSAPADVVTIHLNCYYKGDGDIATKTQEIIVPVTVDASAQFMQFSATFTIVHDEAGNVVDAGDIIALVINLDTGTSDVDNIIVTAMEFYYATTHTGIESGDT